MGLKQIFLFTTSNSLITVTAKYFIWVASWQFELIRNVTLISLFWKDIGSLSGDGRQWREMVGLMAGGNDGRREGLVKLYPSIRNIINGFFKLWNLTVSIGTGFCTNNIISDQSPNWERSRCPTHNLLYHQYGTIGYGTFFRFRN